MKTLFWFHSCMIKMVVFLNIEYRRFSIANHLILDVSIHLCWFFIAVKTIYSTYYKCQPYSWKIKVRSKIRFKNHVENCLVDQRQNLGTPVFHKFTTYTMYFKKHFGLIFNGYSSELKEQINKSFSITPYIHLCSLLT